MTQCAQCGRPLAAGSRFCEHCGARVVAPPAPAPPEPPAPPVAVDPGPPPAPTPPAEPAQAHDESAREPLPDDEPSAPVPESPARPDGEPTAPDLLASEAPPWAPFGPVAPEPLEREGQPFAPEDPPARGKKRRNWAHRGRQLAVAGTLVLLLGILVLGAGLGWTARTLTASPTDTESQVQIVEAPSEGEAAVVVLPDVRGLDTVAAQQALADAGIDSAAVTVVETTSALPPGTVVSQDPVGGTTGATGVTIDVAMSGTIPALVGTDGTAAIQTLVELGVNAAVVEMYDPASPEGLVLALDPPAGSPLTEDVAVTVAGPPGSLYLTELDAAQGGCSTGGADVNGTAYQYSLSCSASTTASTAAYLLNRRAVQLTGLLGVEDSSDTDYVGRVVIRGDGRQLFAADLRYGGTVPFTVPTAGVLRLEIEYSRAEAGSSYPSGYVVVADPRVVGSPADIDLLANQ